MALDPNNPGFTPPTRNADGSLGNNGLGNPTLTYTVTGLPTGASFDADTLLFTWTPSFEQSGPFQVTFTATENGQHRHGLLSATQTVTIDVLPVDRPPLLTPILDQSVPAAAPR